MLTATANHQLKTVISAENVQKRVREMARQISDDYRDREVHVLGILENSFMFMADLVRAMEATVICQFIKPKYTRRVDGNVESMEIFFSHDADVKGKDILLLEGLVHSGVTGEFLMNDLRARGAASVRLATLLDRQSARRVRLQPDYFGFLVDDAFVIGYGLGSPEQTGRNLPGIHALGRRA